MSVGILLAQLMLGSCVGEILWVQFLLLLGDTPQNKLTNFLTYKFSDPLLQGSLSLKCGNILWIYSLGLGYTILDFDWLWFSAVIPLLRCFLHEYYYY